MTAAEAERLAALERKIAALFRVMSEAFEYARKPVQAAECRRLAGPELRVLPGGES